MRTSFNHQPEAQPPNLPARRTGEPPIRCAMLDFLKLFVHVLVSPFKSQARLEAEIVVLRQQLMVLRRRVPSKPVNSRAIVTP